MPPKRLTWLEDLLSQGTPTSAAVESVVAEFGISHRTAWRDVDRVYDQWSSEEKQLRSVRRQQRVKFLERIAHEAFLAGNFAAAVAAMKQVCRVEGLEQVGVAVQHSIQRETTFEERLRQMTSDEKRRKLDELFDRYTERLGGGNQAEEQPGALPPATS